MPLSPIPSYEYELATAAAPSFEAEDTGRALPVLRDLLITDRDLVLTAGDLTPVYDGASIAQEAEIRMRTFLGEWFADTSAGLPWWQSILVKAPNLSVIKSRISDEILDIVGIAKLSQLDLAFDRSARTLGVTWAATTDLGEIIAPRTVVLLAGEV